MVKTRTCVILMILAVIGSCFLTGYPVRTFYMTMRGADLLIARNERVGHIKAIWTSLCKFHAEHGRFPQSSAEWKLGTPDVDHLLSAPRWSNRPYEVHFDRLQAIPTGVNHERDLLIEDPGISWPGLPNCQCEQWRVGLKVDGQIISYSVSYPIYEERLVCP